jgi:integrase
VPPEQTEGQISDYTKLGSSPGGGRPTFTKCRRIFLTSCGSVITARIRIGEPHLKKHILKDPFARKRLSEITRANVLDLRSRLLAKNAPARVIKALGIVKVIFREALFREEINRDPTAGMGRVKYCKVERGIFTAEELRTLFPDHGYGPWKDIQDYTCFYLAAVTGLRRGEILALQWRHIDFERQALTLCEAWKGGREIGPPKWDHLRMVPLSSRTIDKLRQLQMESIRLAPEDFVFAYDDGSRVGETWWRKRFCKALDRAEIDRQSRCLTAHSFRHYSDVGIAGIRSTRSCGTQATIRPRFEPYWDGWTKRFRRTTPTGTWII